mgnify:CR=1 FL=1
MSPTTPELRWLAFDTSTETMFIAVTDGVKTWQHTADGQISHFCDALGRGYEIIYNLLGDITAAYHWKENIAFNVGVYGDLIDGAQALEKNISYTGLVASAEWSADPWGVVGGVKHMEFSDGNRRSACQ